MKLDKLGGRILMLQVYKVELVVRIENRATTSSYNSNYIA